MVTTAAVHTSVPGLDDGLPQNLSVSILIPTHNRCDILVRSIESLRQLTIPPLTKVELVVVANGCTDDTVAKVEALQEAMPFSTRWVQEPKLGLNHARNRAVAEAKGNIIAFLDDDVWVEQGWLEGLLSVFNTKPADIVIGPVVLWWDAVEKPAWMDRRSEHLLSCLHYGPKAFELKQAGQGIGANMAMRREVIERVGLFKSGMDRMGDEILSGGDTDFLARALALGERMFYAPQAEIKHWVAPVRITMAYLHAAAYGNGLARPFLLPELSRGAALWIVLKAGLRAAGLRILEMLAMVCCCRKARIHHHIRRMMSWGNVVGAWRRGIRGKEDMKKKSSKSVRTLEATL